MWGFWDGAHCKQNAPLYREDWSLKPAGVAYQQLLRQTWHTSAQGQTNAQGAYAVRGFVGDYAVRVESGAQRKTLQARRKPEGTTLTGRLD